MNTGLAGPPDRLPPPHLDDVLTGDAMRTCPGASLLRLAGSGNECARASADPSNRMPS